MIKTILVPLDGSPLAERALPYATALARAAGARLIPMYARSELVIADEPPYDVAAVAEKLRADGLEAEPAIYPLYNEPIGPAIVATARERQADLIVMSTHGRGGLGRWLYGSVADQVLRQAETPVMLVSATCDRAWSTDRAGRILVPLDGSDLADEALGPAGALAEALGAELVLLQVVQPPTYPLYGDGYAYVPFDEEAMLTEARRYLEAVAGALRADGRTVQVLAVVGQPATEIARVAREHGADLITMATHGRSGLARLVLGSVATGTLQRTHAPLFLVRPAAVLQATSEPTRRAEIEPAPTVAMADAEPAGPAIAVALSQRDLALIEQGLAELAYISGRDWHLAEPARELLSRLKQSELARV